MGITYTTPPPESTAPVATLQVASVDDPYTAPAVQSWRPVRPAVAPAPAAAPPPTAAVALANAPVNRLPCAPPPATVTPATAPTVQNWQSESSAPLPPCPEPAPIEPLFAVVTAGERPRSRGDAANRQRWAPMIEHIATTYRLEPHLLHAVISAESGYNPKARSPKGARGLMQLMPATARRFGVDDPYDPIENLHGGARYLRWLLDFFRGDLRLALAGYNAGEGAVQRYGNAIPPYSETRTYVRRVLDFYHAYRRVTGL